ncbi:hypothetical protein ADK36_00110 [Streptomyces viridochromogenes]|nr:hypothetical protein ADK36_00110 [Streptomyces viridochromogenes]
MRGFVQIPSDAHGAAASVQDCLHQVGKPRLPCAGLARHNDNDRPLLRDSVAHGRREDYSVPYVEALLLAEHDRALASCRHHASCHPARAFGLHGRDQPSSLSD